MEKIGFINTGLMCFVMKLKYSMYLSRVRITTLKVTHGQDKAM